MQIMCYVLNKQTNKRNKSTKQSSYERAYPCPKKSLFDSKNLGFYLATMGTFVHCAAGNLSTSPQLHSSQSKTSQASHHFHCSVEFQVQICSRPHILSCFESNSHYVFHLLAIHAWFIGPDLMVSALAAAFVFVFVFI